MSILKKDQPEETPNLPVSVEALIKKELAEQSKQLGALPTNKIGLKNKQFTLPDGQTDPGPFDVVVLDFIWFMAYYPGVYNASSPQQPVCFAIGRDKPDSGLLLPDDTVPKPQGEDCKTCPKNEWGSAPSNKGKACKNQRRLILVPPNFDEDSEPMTMYVSPGGLKNFDAYVSRLKNEHGILPVQAITRIQFDKNQSYPLLQFSFVEKHAELALAWALKERWSDMLVRKIELEDKDEKKS